MISCNQSCCIVKISAFWKIIFFSHILYMYLSHYNDLCHQSIHKGKFRLDSGGTTRVANVAVATWPWCSATIGGRLQNLLQNMWKGSAPPPVSCILCACTVLSSPSTTSLPGDAVWRCSCLFLCAQCLGPSSLLIIQYLSTTPPLYHHPTV